MIIRQRTRVEVRARRDGTARVWSRETGAGIHEYGIGAEARRGGWVDYVAGVTVALRARGFDVPGFDLRVETTIPLGGGVSSSAALTVATVRALRACFDLALDDVAVARAAQAVETEFVGAPVGIMDQMAASLGRPNHALFLDTRTLAYRHIPWLRDADLIFVDSGIRHAHGTGEYGTRRRESFEAARLLGVATLRDAGLADLPALARLPPVPARRARHVITENHRVEQAVAALGAGDAAALGRLFTESHASMRDDYEISLPEIDALVDGAASDPRVFGARMTGGGFGGGVIVLTHGGAAANVLASVAGRNDDDVSLAGWIVAEGR
jgi:galactokinase